MSADDNGSPKNARERGLDQVDTPIGETDTVRADVKERARARAAQAREAISGQAGHAVRAAQDGVAQARSSVAGLAARARETTASPEAAPAARRAGVGAAVLGVATAVVVRLLRRRSRRNTDPWHTAARTARAQVKNVRREAKAGLKAARKRSRAMAAGKVATAKAKARKARAKARSWT